MQLFVMDEDGQNVTAISPMTLGSALHPVPLRDGRIMFSTLETQGIRGDILWGLWTIHPDGTNWLPLVSAFDPGGAPNGFHFQTQLSRGEHRQRLRPGEDVEVRPGQQGDDQKHGEHGGHLLHESWIIAALRGET